MHTTDDLESGRRLLVRVDLNAPVDDGEVRDTPRFARHAGSVESLLDDGHAIALLSHQGRPGRDTFVTLEQHADIFTDHVGAPVEYVPSTYGEEALAAIRDLDAGEVVLLENVRMTDDELPEQPAEEHASTDLVRTLAPEFDAYVNDGYSVVHRSHASIVGFPEVMDAYAGPITRDEYEYNTSIERRTFDGPVTMVLGGIKAEDVVAAMRHLEAKVDRFLLGGVVGELFLRAEGYPVGRDVAEDTDLYADNYAGNRELIESILDRVGDRIVLPVDLAYEDAEGDRAEHHVDEIDEKRVSYMDVGSETVDRYTEYVQESAAVLVKGAPGVFEDELFSHGTVELLRAIASSDAFSVVGGGDTSRAVDLYDLEPDAFDHLSIAGGAYLRALTGEPLPGIEALERAADRMDPE